MTDKEKIQKANKMLDDCKINTLTHCITKESNEYYLLVLEKVYNLESETIFKHIKSRK